MIDLGVVVPAFVVVVLFCLWIAALGNIIFAWMNDRLPSWAAGILFLVVFAGPVALGVGVITGTAPR